MTLYLDASALIPLFIAEPRTGDAESGIRGHIAIVSDLATAEFSAGVARRVRMRELDEQEARSVFAHFDAWVTSIRSEAVTPDDVRAATRLVRRFDLALRTPDALNLAIADRCGATVLTFDAKMALAARALGINVLGA